MVGATFVLGAFASDSMLVFDKDPVRREKVLVTRRLERQVDCLILQQQARAVFSQLGSGLANVDGVGVVEDHCGRCCQKYFVVIAETSVTDSFSLQKDHSF